VEITWKKKKVSRFKEILERDMDIFINPKEFAEKVIINGISVNALISSANSKNPKKNYKNNNFYESSYDENVVTVTIKRGDYILLGNLERGNYITLNDSSFKIEKITPTIGVIKLELQRYGAEKLY